MPVSPQDFALWSRMTGNPIPTSPAERMAVAPQVYNMSRGLGRKGGIRSALGETVKSIGSTAARAGALMALGALAEGVDFPAQREEEKPEAEVVEISLDRPSAPVEDRGAEFKVETPRAVTGISLDRPISGIQERGPEFHVSPAREEVSLASGLSTRERAESFISGLQLGAKLQLDDEVAVDNDVIASNPVSNTALASQDITSADPASAIGQRISSNQTSAAVAERAAAEPKQTVASKLSQQQSVVHLDEADNELVGAPAAGAIEALRKGRQYQEMKQRYEGLQDIASPGTEGVSSTDVLPTVQRSTPVPTAQPAPRGASPAEVAEYDAALARGMSTTPQAERIAIRNRHFEKKYGAAPAVVTEQAQVAKPAGVAVVPFLKEKAAAVMPQATRRGTVEHAVAEAKELYEGQLNPPKGTVHGSPEGGSSFIEYARIYPDNTMGVKVRNEGVEYVHKMAPGFAPYVAEMIKSGDFYGADYNEMKQKGLLQPYLGSENLPRSARAEAAFIAKEKARLGL